MTTDNDVRPEAVGTELRLIGPLEVGEWIAEFRCGACRKVVRDCFFWNGYRESKRSRVRCPRCETWQDLKPEGEIGR